MDAHTAPALPGAPAGGKPQVRALGARLTCMLAAARVCGSECAPGAAADFRVGLAPPRPSSRTATRCAEGAEPAGAGEAPAQEGRVDGGAEEVPPVAGRVVVDSRAVGPDLHQHSNPSPPQPPGASGSIGCGASAYRAGAQEHLRGHAGTHRVRAVAACLTSGSEVLRLYLL